MTDAQSALSLLYTCRHGVLSTQSLKLPGYPFGSVLPYCLDATGQPLALISGLAQHTRNLAADAKCCLTLIPAGPAEELLARPRLSLLADAEFLAATQAEQAAARYYRYLPASPDYRLLQDFRFVRLGLRQAQLIAGFGAIHWLEPASLLHPWPFEPEQENAFCEDLNTREAAMLAVLWQKLSGVEPAETVALAGLDALGGDLRCGGQLLRFDFGAPIADLEAAWHGLHQGDVRKPD